MKIGKKIMAVIVAVVLVVTFSVYLVLTTEHELKPALDSDSMRVEFSGMELDENTKMSIKSVVLAEIIAYKGVKYDVVNISAIKKGNDYDLRVICSSNECEYTDVYDFTYYGAERELIQRGYVLEAIPHAERARATSVAFQNEEAANLLRANNLETVTPTVRRVLPETAEKFYSPKTLLSVTWTKLGENPVVVSVLVDPDERKAVSVWSNVGERE